MSGNPNIAGPPYSLDFFQTLVDIHFGSPIYLVVKVFGQNGSGSFGPGAAPSIGSASVSCHPSDKRVKLIDAVSPPSFNTNPSTFQCFRVETNFFDAAGMWAFYKNTLNEFAPTAPPQNGSCAWLNIDDPTSPFVGTPCDFSSNTNVATFYLFSIPRADNMDLVQAEIGGIVSSFSTPIEGPNWTGTSQDGQATIVALVFSTVKGKITAVSQLIDYLNDGKPRPTEDDQVFASTNGVGGSWTVGIHKDKNKADAQTDNYGKTFQPYKVTLTPPAALEIIPPQPPPRLG